MKASKKKEKFFNLIKVNIVFNFCLLKIKDNCLNLIETIFKRNINFNYVYNVYNLCLLR